MLSLVNGVSTAFSQFGASCSVCCEMSCGGSTRFLMGVNVGAVGHNHQSPVLRFKALSLSAHV